MKILCVFGQHNYGNQDRGEGYEFSNFIPAFKRLGHEVLFFESWNRSVYKNLAELNRSLLNVVEKERPDLVFSVIFTYEIWLETWNILRELACTVSWTTDDSWKYKQFSRLVAPSFDAFTTTYPEAYLKYKKDGIPHVILTQWAANAGNLQLPLPASQCQIPVSFIGTAHGKRKSWIHALQKRGINIHCYGYGWDNGAIAAEDIPKVVRNSIISLNFSNSSYFLDRFLSNRRNQIKARIFEVPGFGGFLLTDSAEHLEQYFLVEKEISVFRNQDDLASRIKYFLRNPEARDNMAIAANKRVRLEHTYDQRFAEVLEFSLKQKRDSSFQKKTFSNQMDWDSFNKMAYQQKMGRMLITFKKSLLSFCSMVFGPTLGFKISRRLIFEISWRFFGAKTYRASGWPGRLFP